MVTRPDSFIALSGGLGQVPGDLPEGKTLVVDEDLVRNLRRRRGSRSSNCP